MFLYGCSFETICELLYGVLYDKQLNKWRICIPGYYEAIGNHQPRNNNNNNNNMNHLPEIANYNAYSHMWVCPMIVSKDKDINVAMRKMLQMFDFPFATLPSSEEQNMFQLAAIWNELNFHQRVWIALQIAKMMYIIREKTVFRFAGKFVMDTCLQKPVIGRTIVNATAQSRCAFVCGVRPIRKTETVTMLSECKQYIKHRLTYLKQFSLSQNILEPFLDAAHQICAELRSTKRFENRLLVPNLVPCNIYVRFRDDMPHIVCVRGWDVAESVPSEIAQCWVPGWLWNARREPPNGFDPTITCKEMDDDIVRISFVDKMEQLQPGYVSQTSYFQNLNLGLLGRIARTGLDFGDPRDVAFHAAAYRRIISKQTIKRAKR